MKTSRFLLHGHNSDPERLSEPRSLTFRIDPYAFRNNGDEHPQTDTSSVTNRTLAGDLRTCELPTSDDTSEHKGLRAALSSPTEPTADDCIGAPPTLATTRHDRASTMGKGFAVESEPTHSDDASSWMKHKQEQEIYQPPSSTPRVYWTSFWLRRATLLSLVTLIIGLFVSLIAIWLANRSKNGFRLVLGVKNHYSWTYGPTAVLVVVLSLWRQVDYHCKLIQPWEELRKSPATAERSILLDYLSPTSVTSLTRAFRYRHVPVAASIMGFILIKAVTIFSTGLLTLEDVPVPGPCAVSLTESFGNLNWDTISAYSNRTDDDVDHHGDYVVDSLSKTLPLYGNISDSLVNLYLWDMAQRFEYKGLANGLDTENILDDATFQAFRPLVEPGTEGYNVSADVEAFYPNVSCEMAKPTLRVKADDKLVVQLQSNTCSVGARNQSDIEVQRPRLGSEAISYNIWRVNCSEVDATEKFTVLSSDTPYDFRFALLVSDLSHLNLTSGEDSTSSDTLITPSIAAVICNVDYAMYRSTLVLGRDDDVPKLHQLAELPLISNFTGMMLGEMVFAALSKATSLKLDKSDPASPLFYILPQILDGPESTKRPLSSEELILSTQQMFAGVSRYLVRERFLQYANITASGTCVLLDHRLFINDLPIRLMLAGLASVIILITCIIWTVPRDVIPQDPRLLLTDAAILVASPALQALLEKCHDLRTSQITASLCGFKYSISADANFRIELSSRSTSGESECTRVKSNPWIPLSAMYPMICLTLITPILAIAVLEILYRISTHSDNDGFATVTGFERPTEYLLRYASAILVYLIATCFNSLDFTTASFAPYSRLRSGPLPDDKGTSSRIIGSLPPVALFRSIKSRHGSSFFSNLASIVGSVLAIVASGLWLIDREVYATREVRASLSSKWDIEWPNSSTSGDAGAASLFDRIQHGSAYLSNYIADLPVDGLHVLPDIANIRYPSGGELHGDMKETNTSSQGFSMQIDALRPLLSCEVVDDKHIKIDYTEGPDSLRTSIRVSAFPYLPAGCHQGNESGSNYNFSSEYWFTEGNKTNLLGNLYDLHLGSQTTGTSPGYGEHPTNGTSQPDSPAGCPSIGVIFGIVSPYDTNHDEIVAVTCSQKLMQRQLNVTYKAANWTRLIPSGMGMYGKRPEGFSQNITNGTEGIDSFPYRIQSYLQDSSNNGNLTKFTVNATGSTTSNRFMESIDSEFAAENATGLDAFMNHLIFGPGGHAPHTMLSKSNGKIFVDSLNALYQKYMCLVIDRRFRVPVEPEDNAPVYGIMYKQSSRIKVNKVSKIVMQAMLGVMAVLGLLTILLTDLRRTLPRKPSSIASRMALLAGSDLCDEQRHLLPRDAIWRSEKDLAKLFDGWLFSLGWWNKSATAHHDHYKDTAPHDSAVAGPGRKQEMKRFGIDVGTPEELGFRKRKW